MPWVVRSPNGDLVHSWVNGQIKTVDAKYPKYARRYSRQRASKVADAIGGVMIQVNPDGSLGTVKGEYKTGEE